MEGSSLVPATTTIVVASKPEPVGPLLSVLRHPLAALVPLVAMVGVAAAIGLSHGATYTADALLSVGRVNVPAFTLQGVIQGNATLAANYARAIKAPAVYESAARRARVTASTANSDLTASPIPESTLIRVEAMSGGRDEAIAIANGGGRALIRYVQTLNRDPISARLLDQYRQVQVRLTQLHERIAALNAHPGKSVAKFLRSLGNANVDLQTTSLRSLDLQSEYQAARANQPSPAIVQLLSPATTASSDHTSVLEQVLLVGGVVGAVLGVIFALMLENREWLRRTG
jgi:hypothetical protein